MCTCTDASNVHATIYVCLPTRWTSGYVSTAHVRRAPALWTDYNYNSARPSDCIEPPSEPSEQSSELLASPTR